MVLCENKIESGTLCIQGSQGGRPNGLKLVNRREIVTHENSPKLLVGDPEVKVLKTDACVRDRFLERLS